LETLAQNGTEAAASSWKFVGKKGRGTDSVPRHRLDGRQTVTDKGVKSEQD